MNLDQRQASIQQDLAIAAARQAAVQALNEKEEDALAAVASGMSMAGIAKRLGMKTAAGASRYVTKALEKRARQIDSTPVSHARALMLTRLELLISQWMPTALMGDEKIGRLVLDALTREAKLLGLEAPKQVETTVHHEVEVKTPEQRREAIVSSLEEFKKRVIDGEATAA